MQKDDRQIWIDAVRITAGISIVVLHATADPTGQPWVAYSQSERVGPMLLRAVVYTARTELFLIIALFLLLLAHEKTPRTYRQTLAEQSRRLLVPFAFWTLFYAFYGLIKALVERVAAVGGDDDVERFRNGDHGVLTYEFAACFVRL